MEGVESDLLASKLKLLFWPQREESCLAQQAKQKWVENGEANVQFYCALNGKRQKIVKEMHFRSGRLLESPETIHNGVVQYFEVFME